MDQPRQHAATALAALVAGTFFMELLDGTIVSTAAPAIARSFHVPSATVGITVTAYLVTLAVLVPISGWLTDRVGTKTVFVVAILAFTVASALCAASGSLPELVGWRILQGAAGALMVPVGRLVVLRTTGKDDLVRAIAILTWPALAAPIVAPFLAGVLVDALSWHWIFLVNVPVGVLAIATALVLVPQERAAQRVPFDWRGSALACAGLGGLVVAASLLALAQIPIAATLIFGIGGAVACWLAVRHFRRAEHPILGLEAFRLETFRVSHAGGSLFRGAVSAIPFVLPLLFQDAWGWSALRAGTAVLWVFVGNLGIKPATTPLLRMFGYRSVVIASTAVAVVTTVAMVAVAPTTPFWMLATLLVISGAARSTGFTAYNTLAFADVPQESMTPANTLSSTLQQVASGFGIAVAAVVLRAAATLSGGSQASPAAYAAALWVIAALLAAACLEGILMSRGAGERVRPRRRQSA
ncbi:MFS transporter [Curtobacterium ammoniigenes]|uniref:MFS transporter n=1 Tax=Curtobacterium ammoniigenes TaxID=395387 RepID=UPI000832C8C1|nr:MFS transporter [Curtobacterium ammoniigenes]